MEKENLHEFERTIAEIVDMCINLQGGVDRVHILQWIRKLYQTFREDRVDRSNAKLALDYAKYLKLALEETSGRQITKLYELFEKKPPRGKLLPLSTILGEMLFSKYDDLKAFADICPIVCHKTANGEGVMLVEKDPNGMISTYMAIHSPMRN